MYNKNGPAFSLDYYYRDDNQVYFGLFNIAKVSNEITYIYKPMCGHEQFYPPNSKPKMFGYFINSLVIILKGDKGNEVVGFELFISRNNELTDILSIRAESKLLNNKIPDYRQGIFKDPTYFYYNNNIGNIFKLALSYFKNNPIEKDFLFTWEPTAALAIQTPSNSNFIEYFKNSVWNIYEEAVSRVGKDNDFYTTGECIFPKQRTPFNDYISALLKSMLTSHSLIGRQPISYPLVDRFEYFIGSSSAWSPSFKKKMISANDQRLKYEYIPTVCMAFDMYEYFCFIMDNWEYYENEYIKLYNYHKSGI
ncbi:hypothetical protein EJV47_23360 [Hymenobacter gummosus]|uniref:Uncharacterized protein n=1 Tax=Hymenobacter gummosus TaxID=1776032 RepID=A0A3S0JB43_9BACT|nr:hypothetical protein [Hymenobacter gummosus]RTQ46090.1 hypothetical protein EJV47_23360 [Hymenobacter gummosus]